MRTAGGRGRARDTAADWGRERSGKPRSKRYLGRHRAMRRRRRRKQLPFWQELPLLVVIAFGLALLIKTFLLQAFFIPSGSMENTLLIGDRVLVNKVVYDLRDPRRGEVVVFRGTDSWAPETSLDPPGSALIKIGRALGSLVGVAEPDEKDFVKRVIGIPGDTVQCCDELGRVLVNGEALDEPYVFENNPIEQREFGPITVPAGRLFVLGDHRGLSQDSRAYIGDQWSGTIREDQVIGQAFATVWPVSHWRLLPIPDGFDQIPQASGAVPTPDPTGAVMFFVLVGVSRIPRPRLAVRDPLLLWAVRPVGRRSRRQTP